MPAKTITTPLQRQRRKEKRNGLGGGGAACMHARMSGWSSAAQGILAAGLEPLMHPSSAVHEKANNEAQIEYPPSPEKSESKTTATLRAEKFERMRRDTKHLPGTTLSIHVWDVYVDG